MDNTWLTQAKRLQAIASTGLHFCRDEYDRERYQEIADIAHRMLAEAGRRAAGRNWSPIRPGLRHARRWMYAARSSSMAGSCCARKAAAAGRCRAAMPTSACRQPRT